MKKFAKIIAIIMMMVMMTGCVKFNANMDIHKDKSMDFSIIYAVDTTYFGDEPLFDEEDKEDLAKEGFKLEEYVDENMKGFKLSRDILNIDLVSSDVDAKYSLSGLLSSDEEENKYLFKVKKGFFKNKYTATLDFDSSDSDLTDSEETTDDEYSANYNTDIEYDYDTEYEFEYDTDSTEDLTDESLDDALSGLDMSSMSSVDLSFSVSLPYSALSHNATKATNEDKNLKWELMSDEVSTIEFEFELYNMVNIFIAIGVVLVIIVLVIILLLKKGKKKKGQDAVQQPNQQPVMPTDQNQMIQPVTVSEQQPVVSPITQSNEMAPQPLTTDMQQATAPVMQPEIVPMQQATAPVMQPETAPMQQVTPVVQPELTATQPTTVQQPQMIDPNTVAAVSAQVQVQQPSTQPTDQSIQQ